MLLAVNDLKPEVGCFLKLLIEREIMYEDHDPRRPDQQGAAGKENVGYLKSKNQMPDKFAGTAAKGKGKDKSSHSPSYLPVPLQQELHSDSGSEEDYASIAMIQPRLPMLIDYRALNAHCRKATRKGEWPRPSLRTELRCGHPRSPP